MFTINTSEERTWKDQKVKENVLSLLTSYSFNTFFG